MPARLLFGPWNVPETPSQDLLIQLYRSTVDEREFAHLLELLSQQIQAHTVALLLQKKQSPEDSKLICNRPDQMALSATYSLHARHNVHLQALGPAPMAGDVVIANDVVDECELAESPYYQEFCRPNTIHHVMAGVLFDTASTLACLLFCREAAVPFRNEHADWLHALMPHLLDACAMARKARQLHLANEAAWSVLNQRSFGVMVFSQDGGEVYRNQALREIVDESDLLHWRNGHLDSSDAALSRWLALPVDLLKRAFGADSPLSTTVEHKSERYHFMLAALSVKVMFARHTLIVLLVSDLNNITRSVHGCLRDVYRLTPREVEVAVMLAQGLRARDIAAALRVAESTVLSHKKSLFLKTGVSRQPELVRTLLGA